jgi:hypothetical protein
MNSFTIPLRCHQRNAPMTIARAFWPGVCALHHLGIPRDLSAFLPNHWREKTTESSNHAVNVFLTLTAVTEW